MPAPQLDVPPPSIEVEPAEPLAAGRRIRGRLRSPRGARVIELCLPASAGPVAVRLFGHTATAEEESGWRCYSFVGAPPEGVPIEIDTGPGPLEVSLIDSSLGLPSDGEVPLAASDTLIAGGKTTSVTRRIRL
jgi:hypothetical protein